MFTLFAFGRISVGARQLLLCTLRADGMFSVSRLELHFGPRDNGIEVNLESAPTWNAS